jgi:ribose transport system substrate-binding protein
MFGTIPGRSVLTRGVAAGTCAAVLLLTAACGDDSSDSSAGGAQSSGASSDVSAEVQDRVEQRLAEPADFQPAGDPIPDVASLAGSTVLYIPISLQIPVFQSVLKGMQEAGGHVDVTVEGCDAKISPAGASACINQALAQGVSAVVLDNVSLDFIGQGQQQLKDAGIPILNAQQFDDPGDAQLGYLDTGGPDMIASIADWIAVDSGGDANVVFVAQNDGPTQARYIADYVKPSFKEACPGCTLTMLELPSSQLQNLPSQLGAALLQNPDVDYVGSEFDTAVPLIVTGLKNSPTGAGITVAAGIGDIASLQRVESGQQAYDTVVSSRFLGWAVLDDVLRMLSGMEPLAKVDAPWRAFTSENIGDVTVDQSSIDDESLWGGDTYSADYLELWGVSA